MRWMLIVSIGLFASFSTAGCKDDDDGPVAVENVGVELADLFCPRLDECLGPVAAEILGTVDCRVQIAASYEDDTLPQLQQAISAGTAQYDAAAARTCLNDLADRGCAAFDEIGATVCNDAFIGTIEEGRDCSQTVECIGDAYCRVDALCPGTCTARVGSGEPCTSSDECQTGLSCDIGTCGVRRGEGEACGGGTDPQCRAGFVCQGEDLAEMGTGTCVAAASLLAAPLDGTCDVGQLMLCEEGLSCVITGATVSGTTSECRAAATSGGDCFTGLPEMCPSGEYCDANPLVGAFMGACTASPGEGEACATTLLGANCAVGLTCVENVCRLFRRLGESCTSSGECYSGSCQSNVCAELDVCEAV